MAKIYVDTTRLIDFYEVADDKIVQVEELQKHKSSLVLTEQTIAEFRRNRVQVITRLYNRLKKTIDDDRPQTVAVIQRLPQFKEFMELYRAKGKEILDYLTKLINDEQEDPVAKGILALPDDETVRYFELSDDAFLRAQKRKLLGHPPRSPDAYTIGDEVIWELLLANLREDLIVVTRDKTYEDNLPLLKKEYQKKTGFNFLLVTEKLSEAVERIGAKPTPELIDAEKKEQESLAQASFTREWLPLLMHRWQRSFDNFYSFSHYNKLLFPDAALESGTAVGNLGLIDSDIKK